MISTSTSRVLAGTIAHLENAYALACVAAGPDLLSPWANTAMRIHLASAGPSVHPRPASRRWGYRDCLKALRAAQAELTALPADHGLPLLDLAMVRSSLARAVADTQRLQAQPLPPPSRHAQPPSAPSPRPLTRTRPARTPQTASQPPLPAASQPARTPSRSPPLPPRKSQTRRFPTPLASRTERPPIHIRCDRRSLTRPSSRACAMLRAAPRDQPGRGPPALGVVLSPPRARPSD